GRKRLTPLPEEHGYDDRLLRGRHRRQVAVGGAVDDLAVGVEPRAVTGAVPGLLRVVPVHHAAQVRAGRRALVQRALLVAVDGDLRQAPADDAALAGRDLVGGTDVAAGQPVGVLHA